MSGVELGVSALFSERLNASFAPAQPTAPRHSSFWYVKLDWMSKPCENRRVNLTWSASYQLSPIGANHHVRASLYSGNGRKDWATLAVHGKLAYGSLKPAFVAVVEQICEVNSVRVAGLVRSSPRVWSRAGE